MTPDDIFPCPERNRAPGRITPLIPDDLARLAGKRRDAILSAAREAGLEIPGPPVEASSEDAGEHAAAWRALTTALAFSEFVANTCQRHPDTAADLIGSGDLEREYAPPSWPGRVAAAVAEAADEESLMVALRRLRRREMVRIAARDLAGLADLHEVCRDLSLFAEACVDTALSKLHDWHQAKYGTPRSASGAAQRMVVMGMGKLGAGELNFSSDIDLILLFPESGHTDGAQPLTNDEFFLRVGRRLVHALGVVTGDGIVFRVDMNLRPFGESGPLVMSFDAAETYYHEQGREWERYAWIKARCVAGDRQAGEALLKRLGRFVFRRYLDYGAFDSLRDMKGRITAEVTRKGMADNIKLGPGGIREVEFFGQMFQLIRAGVEPSLRERRILAVLDLLVREEAVPASTRDELADAYQFLRAVEHRLQEAADRQTHVLPESPEARRSLAASMGYREWDDFQAHLSRHRITVHAHFNRLLRTESEETPTGDACHPGLCRRLTAVWRFPADDAASRGLLTEAGYPDPGVALRLIGDFKSTLSAAVLSREGRERIERLMPLVIEAAGQAGRPDIALERVLSLVHSVRTRTSYVSLLLENPPALTHLVRLADTSRWIFNVLSRAPLLLDELIDPRTLYRPPSRVELEAEVERRMAHVPADDLEGQMDELRVFKQVNVLRVAAADITDATPLMRVSDYLSDIAETTIGRALALAWDQLTARHGIPPCDPPLKPGETGFAVIAFGKLGGLELSYGSDLDLVFLHGGADGVSDGPSPVDPITFYARLGQRLVHILSTATHLGRLYEIDMRLRPNGESGILVIPMEGYRHYLLRDAWTWEKQALIRARPIAGDPSLRDRFTAIRHEALTRPADRQALRIDIRDMRERMRRELYREKSGIFELKQGPGGMVDIEFLVQFLALAGAHDHPELTRWTDNVRLIGQLAGLGELSERAAHVLRQGFLRYRTTTHKLNLREQPAEVSSDRFAELRGAVSETWRRYMEN